MAHYYPGTTLGTIDPGTLIRVRLATSYEGTSTLPARVVARGGTWQSELFPETVFPSDSYAEVVFAEAVPGDPLTATWTANVHDVSGLLLATAPATTLMMRPVDATTRFEMRWRDSMRNSYWLHRGSMELTVTDTGGIRAVNHVDLEDYLLGVVPAEAVPTWHIEALKSQAVAARGYAFKSLRPTAAYDVVPTSADQVYGGVNIEHYRTTAAVLATENVVVMYNGAPVRSYFHATAGGHTENNEYAFVGSNGTPTATPLAWLRGQPDVDPNGVPYDIAASNYDWNTGSFTMSQLSSILAKDRRTNTGTLLSLTFKRGVSGRAYQVVIEGTNGFVKVSGGVFQSVYNAHKVSGASLQSNLFYLEPVATAP
jgi:stage II sporulation protein D